MASFVSPLASWSGVENRAGALRSALSAFWRGFALPFSLIAAGLRQRTFRGVYLRTSLVRLALTLALAGGSFGAERSLVARFDRFDDAHRQAERAQAVVARPPRSPARAAFSQRLRAWGEAEQREGRAMIDAGVALPNEPAASSAIVRKAVLAYTWLAWILAAIAGHEGLIVLFSRRWDAWLGLRFGELANVPPEGDAQPPRIMLDLRWLKKRIVNGVRGSYLFAAGLPLLFPLQLVPQIGGWLFAFAAALWGGYWYAVSTAGKSALAWAEDGNAKPPAFVRELETFSANLGHPAPLRRYTQFWLRSTRRDSSAAAMFERSPATFLGLALARLVLSTPGISLFTRSVMPVAASRLCLEAATTA